MYSNSKKDSFMSKKLKKKNKTYILYIFVLFIIYTIRLCLYLYIYILYVDGLIDSRDNTARVNNWNLYIIQVKSIK